MRTCLVTGAAGFLGSRVVSEFASAGYRVTGAGRETDPGDSDDELDSYCCTDLPSDTFVALLEAEQPDVLVHTAGTASVAESMTRPLEDFAGSVGVLVEVLDAVRRHAADARLVFMSSAAVYGNPTSLPVREDAPLRPLSPYGHHKVLAEMLLGEYRDIFGVGSVSLRIFSAYGSGLRRQILWDVCEKAMSGEVRLFGTGEETRDFIHAQDVASAARIVAEKAPMTGEAYNVATGVETTIRGLSERIASCVAPGVPVEFSGEQRPGDPVRWRADISKIAELDFRPRVSLDQGIAEYCAWYLETRRTR